jgi:hypothetical protein
MTMPTKDYRPEYCDKVIELAHDGLVDIEWCADIGICKSTLERWCKANPDFFEACAQANDIAHAWWQKSHRLQSMLPARDTNCSAVQFQLTHRFHLIDKLEQTVKLSGEVNGSQTHRFTFADAPSMFVIVKGSGQEEEKT